MNGDLTRRTLNLDPLTGKLVQRLAVTFERRIHGRNLGDLAGEFIEHRLKLLCCRQDFGLCNNGACEIAGIGLLTETQLGFIGFVGVKQIGRKLGGFAQTQR